MSVQMLDTPLLYLNHQLCTEFPPKDNRPLVSTGPSTTEAPDANTGGEQAQVGVGAVAGSCDPVTKRTSLGTRLQTLKAIEQDDAIERALSSTHCHAIVKLILAKVNAVILENMCFDMGVGPDSNIYSEPVDPEDEDGEREPQADSR